jgi:hypothetical protein
MVIPSLIDDTSLNRASNSDSRSGLNRNAAKENDPENQQTPVVHNAT